LRKINSALERISSLESEIESYKAKKPEEYKGGADAEADTGASGIFCPACGVKSIQGAAFCFNCGKDLRGL
jgi:hypothetical protein